MATPVTPPVQPPRPVILSTPPSQAPIYILIGIILIVLSLILWKLFWAPPLTPTTMDAIDSAAKVWRDGEGPAYRSVGDRIGSGAITNVKDVNPALKETFSPAVNQLNDVMTSTLKSYADKDGLFTNREAAKAALYRAGAAFDGSKK